MKVYIHEFTPTHMVYMYVYVCARVFVYVRAAHGVRSITRGGPRERALTCLSALPEPRLLLSRSFFRSKPKCSLVIRGSSIQRQICSNRRADI